MRMIMPGLLLLGGLLSITYGSAICANSAWLGRGDVDQ